MMKIGLIGPGRVGRSLVAALPREKYLLGPVMGRTPGSSRKLVRDLRRGFATEKVEPFRECAVVLMAVSESQVGEAAGRLGAIRGRWSGVTLLHTCRYCSPALLALARGGPSVAALHPLQSFQRPVDSLNGVHFALSGQSAAIRVARKLVQSMGGQAHVMSRHGMLQAGVAASLASDVVTGVLELATGRLMAAGLSRRQSISALRPLLLSAFDDFGRSGRNSRAGAMTQGDTETVIRLAMACDEDDPDDALLYVRGLRLAMEALDIGDETLRHFLCDDVGPRARSAASGR